MALRSHRWTRPDLHRLPDDGKRYEVIHGELLVSPAPNPRHWALVYALRAVLEPFCRDERLGTVSGENRAFAAGDSEVVPDLVIGPQMDPLPETWDDAPMPLLVIEVLSDSTRRNDLIRKRGFYLESGIPEYWAVDGDARSIRVFTAAGTRVEREALRWHPEVADRALEIDVRELFVAALG